MSFEKQHHAMEMLKDISDAMPWFVDQHIDKLQTLYKSLDVPKKQIKIKLDNRPPTNIKRKFFYNPPNQQSVVTTPSQFVSSNQTTNTFLKTVRKIRVRSQLRNNNKKPMQECYSKLRNIYERQFFVNGIPMLQRNQMNKSFEMKSKKGRVITGRPKFRINEKNISF